MGNEPNVMEVTNELKVTGARKGHYKPGPSIARVDRRHVMRVMRHERWIGVVLWDGMHVIWQIKNKPQSRVNVDS